MQHPDALDQSLADPALATYDATLSSDLPTLAPVPPPPFHPVRISRHVQSGDQATVLPVSSYATVLPPSEQVRLLREAGRAFVTATDQRDILRALLTSLRRASHFAVCSLLLVDEGGNYELRVMAGQRVSASFVQQNLERLAVEALRAGLPPIKMTQLASRQVLDAPDEMVDGSVAATAQPLAEQIEAFLAHPLMSKGRIMGMLGLADGRWGSFTSDHEEFFATLGDYAAVALENLRLHQAEQGLWEEVHVEQERLERIIGTMAEGLLIVDEDGFVHMMNPTAQALLAQAGVETIQGAVSLAHLLGAREEPWLVALGEALEQASRRQEAIHAELAVGVAADSVPLTLHVSASPYHDADGRLVGAVAVLHDITDRKQIEKWKDDFLSSVSHELRTPLTPIKGYTQHLLRRAERRLAESAGEAGDGPGGQASAESYEHRCLGIIQSEAEHLERLVNNLLDFSLLQRGMLQLHPQPFDLVEVVQQVVQSAQISAEEHRITLNIWAATTGVQADRERVRAIIGNVLDNAMKYSPHGGPITVSVLGDEQELVVAVSDKGVGITPEEFAHLFDRFHQPTLLGPHHYGGIGVSLYLAQAILKLHGGRIWAESNRNQHETGATVAFALPRSVPDEERVAPK